MPVGAAEITVNPDSSSIQNAISNKTVLDGDTIILNPGVYKARNIIVTKNITIRANISAGGNEVNTIIDPRKHGRIFYCDGHSLVISNLTLRNGTETEGGAIYLSHGSVTIASSILTDCSAKFGGAIFSDESTLIIDSSSFSNCSSTENSGAIWSNGIVDITSSSFSKCRAQQEGGVICTMVGGSINVNNTTFNDCSARTGGVIYSESKTTGMVASSSFSNCSVPNYGGAISSSGNLSIISSTFSNCSSQALGGAIVNGGDLSITSSTFSDCSALWNGGAIYTYGGNISLHFSRITNCNTGKAVYKERGYYVNAVNNWWGSNADPSEYVHNATVSPWLMLDLAAIPSSITTAQTAVIQTNLTRNSDGIDTSTGGIFVPDGITNIFAVTEGNGSVLLWTNEMKNGAATTTFIPAGAGNNSISATVDGQKLTTRITVTTPGKMVPGFEANLALIAVFLTIFFINLNCRKQFY